MALPSKISFWRPCYRGVNGGWAEWAIDNQYIDFDSLLPLNFKSFWRNKIETKYVHVRLVSTYYVFCASPMFTYELQIFLFKGGPKIAVKTTSYCHFFLSPILVRKGISQSQKCDRIREQLDSSRRRR